jgi:hypothetical protein
LEKTPELAISAALGLAALPLRSAWPLRLASEYGKQGQGVHVPGGNFTRWPVRGAGAAMARDLGLYTGTHDAPKVCMFLVFGCDVPLPIKPATPWSWRSSLRRLFREFSGGRKACRSFGVASEHFAEYLLLFYQEIPQREVLDRDLTLNCQISQK